MYSTPCYVKIFIQKLPVKSKWVTNFLTLNIERIYPLSYIEFDVCIDRSSVPITFNSLSPFKYFDRCVEIVSCRVSYVSLMTNIWALYSWLFSIHMLYWIVFRWLAHIVIFFIYSWYAILKGLYIFLTQEFCLCYISNYFSFSFHFFPYFLLPFFLYFFFSFVFIFFLRQGVSVRTWFS